MQKAFVVCNLQNFPGNIGRACVVDVRVNETCFCKERENCSHVMLPKVFIMIGYPTFWQEMNPLNSYILPPFFDYIARYVHYIIEHSK